MDCGRKLRKYPTRYPHNEPCKQPLRLVSPQEHCRKTPEPGVSLWQPERLPAARREPGLQQAEGQARVTAQQQGQMAAQFRLAKAALGLVQPVFEPPGLAPAGSALPAVKAAVVKQRGSATARWPETPQTTVEYREGYRHFGRIKTK